ncbi:hypothetical protein LSAT2_005508 [Lamellibrachia satsuma]|nr:hypothetical protein LSAT2_005508 [Lamellibrachia satsuma]
MAPCKRQVKATRHLICDSCSNWVDFIKSRCEKSWAEVQVDSFSFECRGCTKMKELEVELEQLRLLVVAVVGREQHVLHTVVYAQPQPVQHALPDLKKFQAGTPANHVIPNVPLPADVRQREERNVTRPVTVDIDLTAPPSSVSHVILNVPLPADVRQREERNVTRPVTVDIDLTAPPSSVSHVLHTVVYAQPQPVQHALPDLKKFQAGTPANHVIPNVPLPADVRQREERNVTRPVTVDIDLTAPPSKCTEHCDVCSATDCTTCSSGFIKVSGGTICKLCDPQCTTASGCSTKGGEKCDSACNSGYRLDGTTFKCVSCDPQCTTASGCSTKGGEKCDTACSSGYRLDGTTFKCVQCADNCVRCDHNGAGLCDTGRCEDNYRLSATKTCESCGANCRTCDVNGAGKCDPSHCKPGWKYNAGTQTCMSISFSWVAHYHEYLLMGTSLSRVTPHEYPFFLMDTTFSRVPASYGYLPSLMEASSLVPPHDYLLVCNVCDVNGATKCDPGQCKDGFSYSAADKSCTAVTGCLMTIVTTTTTYCPEGYCDVGFVWSSASRTCTVCPTDCESCYLDGTTSKCLMSGCKQGFARKTDEICVDCPANCLKCTWSSAKTKTICETEGCDTGYVLKDESCEVCPDNCLMCTWSIDKTVCGTGKCKTGYVQNTDDARKSCIVCPTKCETCSYSPTNNRAECSTCMTGSTVSPTDKTCGDCASNCASCASTEPGKCDTCNIGFRLKADKTCEACDPNCEACSTNGVGKCDSDKCNNKFGYNSQTKMCVACPAKCQQCTVNAAGTAECSADKCDSGYGLKDADKTCQECSSYCATCTDEKKDGVMVCDTCNPHFELNDDVCAACPANCLECSESNGAMVCSTCKSHYVVMDDKTCSACPLRCDTCSQTGGTITCDTCQSDYVMDKDKACKTCSEVFEYCKTCTSADNDGKHVCNDCYPGFTLKDDKSACLSCDSLDNCGVCKDDALVCDTCSSGYTPNDDKNECGVMCYECKGSGCDSLSNDKSSLCLINSGQGCWMEMVEVGDVKTHTRTCSNVTCSSTYNEEYCQEASGKKECKQCCSSNNCNNKVLTGAASGFLRGGFWVKVNLAVASLITYSFSMLLL